ncbi:hypothetical protein ATM97_18890 [Nocardia sp. MH4]|uniref:hypothetical protein n=1 Tax=Nocardia sp. MH4 TaxID=1768677 RepID=UPI001C5007F1|nr:hypothetical protein [Nocardia sp. MH4]MBW0272281.1 hypothetical protein [Nocardia sp. MH4]
MADKLTTSGDAIDNLDVRTAVGTLAGALPGCDIPRSVELAAEFVEGAYLRAAERLREVANKSRNAASNLQTTDEQFSQMLREMDVRDA